MVRPGQLLSQGEQGHWASETGIKHPSGEKPNGRGAGRRLMAIVLPNQLSLYIVYIHIYIRTYIYDKDCRSLIILQYC